MDDLLVVYRNRLKENGRVPCVRQGDPDAELLRRTTAAYEAANLECSDSKRFRYETRFKAWGAEVQGIRGTVGAPTDARLALMRTTLAVVQHGAVHRRLMQRLLGHFNAAFAFRRCLPLPQKL